MIRPSPPRSCSWAWRRRAFARRSRMLRSEESSNQSGASASSLAARRTFGQSRWLTWPLRSLSPGIRARQAMKRWASSTSDISSEKKATGLSRLTATFSAMLATRALFPIAGRAATMIRLPGWKPPVTASMSRKPGGELLQPVDLVVEDVTEDAEVGSLLFVGDFEEQFLGPLGEFARFAVAVVDPALDFLARAEQPAQQRVLLDDLGVVLRVAGSGDLGGELGDVVFATHFVDLVRLRQRLGDGELVDRLGGRVEVVDRFEDRPVAVEVEVG